MKAICITLTMLCAAMGSANAVPMTYLDDGDAVYNGGRIVLGPSSTGTRPASGSSYDGTIPLTVWGDTARSTCRQSNRVSAFVCNDVGLDMSRDWRIDLDVTNDLVSPDIAFRLWLLTFQPTAATLNSGDLRDRMTFCFVDGDQLVGDNLRGGFGVEANLISGWANNVMPGLRLDPDPNSTALRSGHNYVTVQWSAATQRYDWQVSNLNGTRSFSIAASELSINPATTYFAAGTTDNSYWMGSGWTIRSLTYTIQYPPPLNIGQRKQLLVDDYVVSEMSNVTRELGQATKANNGQPLIVADKPWEDPDIFRLGSVIHDGGKFKMRYQLNSYNCGYAESEDGLNWTKPNLGLYEYQGSWNNNILPDFKGYTCFPDLHETDPAHKYKSAYGSDDVKACIAHSADGFNWIPYNNGLPVTGRAADTINQLLWDDYAKTYRLYTRTDFSGTIESRGTRDMTNPDVKANPTNWTTIRSWRFDREGSNEYLRRQIYALNGWLYEGVHFGILYCYEWPTDLSEGGYDTYTRHERDILNFYILTCRGNEMWDLSWVYAQKPLIPRGPSGSFDKDWVQASPNIITWQDKHWIYYCGAKERHNIYTIRTSDQTRWQAAIGLATLRLDGFVSLDAGDQTGTVLTKPLLQDGNELEINADASGGSILVEILDAAGQPVPGYTAADCDPITTDSIRHLVTWKGRSRLENLPAGAIELRFSLTRAKLYSFQFQTAPAATAVASVAAAKALPDSDSILISINGAVATGRFAGSFYIEDSDRSSGMRVISPAPVSEGDVVVVTGTLRTVAGEREIVARDVRQVSP